MTHLVTIQKTTAAAALLGLLLFVGCHHDSDHHHGYHYDFYYSSDYYDYTFDEQFRWDTPYERAYVQLEAVAFSGEVRVQIYDDHDVVIYDTTFFGEGNSFYVSDETFHGDPGEWVIIISPVNAIGSVYINIF